MPALVLYEISAHEELAKILSNYLELEQFTSDYNNVLLEYTDPLAKILQEQNELEDEYNNIKKQQGWGTWIKASVVTTPEYEKYYHRKQELEKSRQNKITEFIEALKEKYAIKYVQSFIDSKNITEEKDKNALKILIHQQMQYFQDKDYFSDRIDFLLYLYGQIQYKAIDKNSINTTLIQQHLGLIDRNVLKKSKMHANSMFNTIAGSYMLTRKKQNELIQELFFIQCQLSINSSDPKIIERLNDDTNRLVKTITAEIETATKNYVILPTVLEKLQDSKDHASAAGWLISNNNQALTKIEQATRSALAIFNNIQGTTLLPDDTKREFINKLTVLEQKEQQAQQQQYRVTRYLLPYQEADKKHCLEAIDLAIHETFQNDPSTQKNFTDLKEQLQTNLISDSKLQIELENLLLRAIIAQKEEVRGIHSLQTSTLEKVSMQIEIAQLLCNIKSFQDLPIVSQIKKISEIQEVLNKIASEQAAINEKDSINFAHNKIDEYKMRIKNIIDNIAADSSISKDTIANLRGNSVLANWWDNLKIALDLPQIQGAVAGATVGLLSAVAAPLLGNVLGLGAAVPAIGAVGTGVAATIGGAMVGYKYPIVRYIFTPFQYILHEYPIIRHIFTPVKYIWKEISDIYNKPKSYIDRAFRAGAMLTSTTGMVVGISMLVAVSANPFSGPVVAGIVVGGIATVAVVAASAKLANMISNKAAKLIYGIQDPDLYLPSEKAIEVLGGETQANQVVNFFKQEISATQNELDKLSNKEKNSWDGTALKHHLQNLKTTWEYIQKGDVSYWATLANKLFNKEKDTTEKSLKNIDTRDIVHSLVDLILPKKSDKTQCQIKNDEAAVERLIGPRRELLSFKQQNKAIEHNDHKISELKKINDIFKKKY